MTDAAAPAASIIVPLRNGGPASLETMRAVLRQELDGGFEVIVIDSESSDGSPEAIQCLFTDPQTNPRRIALRLVRIAARDFGHGKTRNQGAQLAAGDVIVFLSQDATPVGVDWLTRMIRPLNQSEPVAVFCRQVARSWASLPERFILETTYPPQPSIRTNASLARRDAGYIMFSNAASAILSAALRATPFKENLMMCEDAHWAAEALEAGHSIAYTVDAAVMHSHGYSLSAALSRTFDYTVAFAGVPGGITIPGYASYLAHGVRFAARHGGPRGVFQFMTFEAARCSGFVLGSQYRRLPQWLCRRLSGYPSWFDSKATEASSQRTSTVPNGSAPCR